ncbi:MAG: nuclear transport factor 2 family protein [Gammaproteobacteria bacterium]|nr:nuclear transport factor 2 family protein [Gammaproteobacteria bacterium]
MSSEQLITSLFAAIDNKDMDGFLKHLGQTATFRFGSAPAVSGRNAIREAVAAFFESVAALKHELRRAIADGNVLVCEGVVTYTRHDERRVTLPFANVFEIEGGIINDYRIYIDIGPLYA